MNYGRSEELLRALIRSDMARYEALGDELREGLWPDAGRFLSMTFFVAATRKFADDTTVDEIIGYVADLRARLPETDKTDPRVAELLLRVTVRDEDASVSEFTPDQRVHAQQIIIHDIMSQEDPSDEELDAFFAEVRDLLGENSPAS